MALLEAIPHFCYEENTLQVKYKPFPLLPAAIALVIIAAVACSPSAPQTVEVPVTVPVEVTRLVESEAPETPKEPIVFNDLNWTSAQLQNRIAQYIVEKGYDYPTDVVFGATLPLFHGLRRGDSHVTMEIWLPNQDEVWEEAQTAGEVISAGQSLSRIWQSAFVIPAYMQEEYPELDSVDDLKDPQYRELFATPETGGKARLVSCLIGWACEDVNAAQIESYGLSEHIYVVNPGDREIANTELFSRYEKRKPWLGYQDSVNDPVLLLDLVRLAEPEYSDQCWLTDKACAYEDATILIAVNPELAGRAPEVVAMLRKWRLNEAQYTELASWQIDHDASYRDTAIWWLNSYPEVWRQWVTESAAAGIDNALAAGEEAEGWPDE